MRRYLVLILFLVKICAAVTSIGITDLYYPSVGSFSSNPIPKSSAESNVLTVETKFNQLVISQIKTQIITVTPLLKKTLLESGTFNVFDGNNILSSWITSESGLIRSWEYESDSVDMQITDKVATESGMIIRPRHTSNKYILVGWITAINAHEVKEVFPGTTKSSLLYSLNIEVKYKLIDVDSKEVVTQFVAAGHGGSARIFPSNLMHVSHNATQATGDIVDEAINSLVISVKHGLLIKQSLGMLPN
jgi:hypothetical protein